MKLLEFWDNIKFSFFKSLVQAFLITANIWLLCPWSLLLTMSFKNKYHVHCILSTLFLFSIFLFFGYSALSWRCLKSHFPLFIFFLPFLLSSLYSSVSFNQYFRSQENTFLLHFHPLPLVRHSLLCLISFKSYLF